MLGDKTGEDMAIFSGNANPDLAREIAAYLGTTVGDAVINRFNNGEVQVMINESVRGKDVFVIQPTCGPAVNDNVMELLIMCDAFKRASARHITAVVPFYGYARQDRKARGREPITAKLMADLMTVSGITRLVTVDLHAAQIQGFFDIPVDNLLGSPLFVDYFKSRFGDDENTMVVSPDVGSVARARAFAQKLGMTMAIVDKRRQKANSSEVMSIIGDVKGKRVILLDDMVDTAGSLCGAAKALVEIGGATEVYACASHGVLSGPAIQRIEDSVIKEVLFLDTIPAKEGVKCDKIKYLSAAPMLADAISFIYHEDSVSRLFV